MQQGGGVTKHEGVKVYVDLIVKDFHSITSEYPQSAELFSTFAKYTQGKSNFGYAELDRDQRLKDALYKKADGFKYYMNLYSQLPIITVSSKILGEMPDNVEIFKLSDLEKDPAEFMNNILNSAHIEEECDKDDFLNGLERLNKILSLKPGFLGISINVNQIIDNWIQNKRAVIHHTRHYRA